MDFRDKIRIPAAGFFTFVFFMVSVVLNAEILFKPAGYVNDFANVIDGNTESELSSIIARAEQKTGSEIAVVTVPSLDGMTVEEYAVKLFNEWKIGKKGKDTGVLVLVAPTERKVRIEVGYGLEPVLPDGLAGEIIREQFIPHFKTGDFSRGILAGVGRVAGIVSGGKKAPERPHGKLRMNRIFDAFFIGLFVVIGLFVAGLGAGSRVISLVIWGSFFGGFPFITLASSSKIIFLPIIAVSFILGIIIGRKNPETFHTKSNISGWDWSSDGGGFSGGSGFGGFGGGSSGGGGASGSW